MWYFIGLSEWQEHMVAANTELRTAIDPHKTPCRPLEPWSFKCTNVTWSIGSISVIKLFRAAVMTPNPDAHIVQEICYISCGLHGGNKPSDCPWSIGSMKWNYPNRSCMHIYARRLYMLIDIGICLIFGKGLAVFGLKRFQSLRTWSNWN